MRLPFVSLARHLEEQAALREQLATAVARLKAAEDRADAAEVEAERFRIYYERLADDTLMRRGDASGPIHSTPEDRTDPQVRQVARAFGLVGNSTGANITGPRDAAKPTPRP